jgi:hypothetical protein
LAISELLLAVISASQSPPISLRVTVFICLELDLVFNFAIEPQSQAIKA